MSHQIAGVTEKDDLGVIMQAQHDAKAQVVDVQTQEGQVAAAETKAKGQQAEADKETGATKKDPEAAVYADLAADASGLTSVKVAKALYDTVQDMDPGKFGGMNTFEDIIGGAKPKVAKTNSKAGEVKKTIETEHSFNLASKGNIASSALHETGNTGKWDGLNTDMPNVHMQKELVFSKKLASEQKLSQAIRAEQQKGPQMAQARGMGMGGTHGHMSLRMDSMAKGPKIDSEKLMSEGVRDDGTSSWATT